jgi:hypothetical protein
MRFLTVKGVPFSNMATIFWKKGRIFLKEKHVTNEHSQNHMKLVLVSKNDKQFIKARTFVSYQQKL